MRNVQEAGLTESDETGEIRFLPCDRYRNSHRFPSSKRKQHDEGLKKLQLN